jgi:hypothetical protein
MKSFARFGWMGSGLALILLLAAPSFATVVGALNLGGNGGVSGTPLTLSFENDTAGGQTEVGTGTTLTFGTSATPLVIGQPVDINGGAPLSLDSLGTGVPLTFPDEPSLSINLTSVGPGSANTNCAGLMTGESCSPIIGSTPTPLILTYTGSGTEGTSSGSEGTSLSLSVAGTASDGGSTVSDVTGLFTATVSNETPEQIVTTDSFSPSTYSAGLNVTPLGMAAAPEPRAVSLVLLACFAAAVTVIKRRRREA